MATSSASEHRFIAASKLRQVGLWLQPYYLASLGPERCFTRLAVGWHARLCRSLTDFPFRGRPSTRTNPAGLAGDVSQPDHSAERDYVGRLSYLP